MPQNHIMTLKFTLYIGVEEAGTMCTDLRWFIAEWYERNHTNVELIVIFTQI